MMEKAVVLSLVLVICVTADLVTRPPDPTCPEAEDISPCICTVNEDFKLAMDCSDAQDEAELERVFQADFPDVDFYELRIEHDQALFNSSLTSITATTLGDVSFERIIIHGTQLLDVESYALANSYETLTYLDLASNSIQMFPFMSLPRYIVLNAFIIDDNNVSSIYQIISTSLEVFSVSRNPLSTLHDSLLSQSPALSEVYFAETDLEALVPGLFSSLSNLTTLDLSDNAITTLGETAIKTPSSTLSFLNLDNNQISFIHNDAILGLSTDATLSLRNNEITTLDQDSWLHIFQQLHNPGGLIDLKGNPMTCGCDLAWIMLDPEDRYRLLISDTTRCHTDGPILIFLDITIFEKMC